MFSDTGGGRAHQHNSKMGALPDNVLYVMLLCLPLLATAASTRSPRSCHLPVAGDRPALPAKSPSLPVALMGVAPEWARLNSSELLDSRPRERPVKKTIMGPALACHHARASSFWDAASRRKPTDARLSTRWVMAAPMRQRAPSPEVHSHRWITLKSARVMRAAWATSGTAPGELRLAGAVPGWSDASQLPPKAEDRSSSDMRDARMLTSLRDSEHIRRPTDTGSGRGAHTQPRHGTFRLAGFRQDVLGTQSTPGTTVAQTQSTSTLRSKTVLKRSCVRGSFKGLFGLVGTCCSSTG
jgi:hypothetical protein